MNIKSLLLGSAAAVVAATGANAADAIIAPEPEAVEYVRVCDAYGAGYFYIPGTETCLRIGGYVRYDIKGGDNVENGFKHGGWKKHARLSLQVRTASETELGTLSTFTELRAKYDAKASGVDDVYAKDSRATELEYAYIDLGGFRVGLAPTKFKDFVGGLGGVMNDDIVSDGQFTRTGQIAYTFAGGNGFSAVIAVEQGGADSVIDEYVPHVVGGLKFAQGWGSIAAVAAYDAVIEDWAAKVRADVNVSDQISLWVMGGFSGDKTNKQAYGAFGGKWAVWGGATFKATDKAAFNLQAATEDWGKTSVSANVAYELVPGFKITPEVTWTRFKNNSDYNPTNSADFKKNSVQGMIRFQRSF
ncbi:porin [Paenochrobactrum glaciei]|uniref:Porin n=1 Tax=Paenochrobactrum glaciei TaxID=486407 RepID=A0ABN1FI26_9HYPH